MSENIPFMLRIQEVALAGGDFGAPAGKGTKTERLAKLGWRILPVPRFFAAKSLWHDDAGNGNPAFIDFDTPANWLVIPPQAWPDKATKFDGRRAAISWAWKMTGGAA